MLTGFLNTLATIISVTSLLIVTYGALIGVISFFRNELKRLTGNYSITNIRKLRAVFGTYLLLGLEFLIASDILKTVLEQHLQRQRRTRRDRAKPRRNNRQSEAEKRV